MTCRALPDSLYQALVTNAGLPAASIFMVTSNSWWPDSVETGAPSLLGKISSSGFTRIFPMTGLLNASPEAFVGSPLFPRADTPPKSHTFRGGSPGKILLHEDQALDLQDQGVDLHDKTVHLPQR